MSTGWLHDLDPYAIELWDGGPIRWYGLAYLVGFLIGFTLIRRVLRVGGSPLPVTSARQLVFALALGAVVGGRLGYVAFYQPSLLWTFSDELPFWNALAINKGGMASHGGMIGVVVAALVFARRSKVAFLHVLDLAAFAAPLGLFFGRLANFVNGELYGRAAPADLSWGVKFPQEMFAWSTDQLAALSERLRPLGKASLAVPELIDAIQRGDAAIASAISPLLTLRHPSQIYEALLEGALVFAVLALAWRRPKKPGIIAALFALNYGSVRILGEQFRLPDAPLTTLGALELTRGQLLSIGLIAAGVVVFVVAYRTQAVVGGWSASHPSASLPSRTQPPVAAGKVTPRAER